MNLNNYPQDNNQLKPDNLVVANAQLFCRETKKSAEALFLIYQVALIPTH